MPPRRCKSKSSNPAVQVPRLPGGSLAHHMRCDTLPHVDVSRAVPRRVGGARVSAICTRLVGGALAQA
jgi:hypothetical protein